MYLSLRFFYSILFYLALPYIFIRLWWRSRTLPEYRQRLLERLGVYPFKLEKCIWIHAVSVGESIAAIPLIKALQSLYPAMPVLVTTMTPTGAARIEASLGASVFHAYLPYDLPHAVQRFLDTMNPTILLIMETELWPNLLAYSYQREIPICLMNARLSEQSVKGYQRVAMFTRTMLSQIYKITAQGERDATRFLSLGAKQSQIIVTGNIKFDLEYPDSFKEKSRLLRDILGKDRFVWIAASTHEGEEQMILQAHQYLREKNPEALLILVPRHPDRFDQVARECERHFETSRRSHLTSYTAKTAVYLGDTMGELLLLYDVADVAFVGGSLVNKGGHNLLEPALLGKAIVTGPYLFNFSEISALFTAANALILVKTVIELSNTLVNLMDKPIIRNEMGKQAYTLVKNNRGALQKQIRVITDVISASKKADLDMLSFFH